MLVCKLIYANTNTKIPNLNLGGDLQAPKLLQVLRDVIGY